MIFSIILLILYTGATIEDSLLLELDKNTSMKTIEALNTYYVQHDEYNKATILLEEYENKVDWNEQAVICLLIADNLLYRGSLLGARDKYLLVVSRYTKSPAANDALERLYMLESARVDTFTLKRLTYALSRLYCEQWDVAEDSLKQLLDTPLTLLVYYHLALLYEKICDMPLALSTLDALEQRCPAHNLLSVPLLRAEIYIASEKFDQACTILEDLIIKYPQSIYAVRARSLLVTIP